MQHGLYSSHDLCLQAPGEREKGLGSSSCLTSPPLTSARPPSDCGSETGRKTESPTSDSAMDFELSRRKADICSKNRLDALRCALSNRNAILGR